MPNTCRHQFRIHKGRFKFYCEKCNQEFALKPLAAGRITLWGCLGLIPGLWVKSRLYVLFVYLAVHIIARTIYYYRFKNMRSEELEKYVDAE